MGPLWPRWRWFIMTQLRRSRFLFFFGHPYSCYHKSESLEWPAALNLVFVFGVTNLFSRYASSSRLIRKRKMSTSRIWLTAIVILTLMTVSSEEASAMWVRGGCCRPSMNRCSTSVSAENSRAPIMTRLQIEETYRVRRRLPDGRIVEEQRTRMRNATVSEAIDLLQEQLQQLDQQVFGGEPNRDRPLEQRVDVLEGPTGNSL
jgi:hypothetical protein